MFIHGYGANINDSTESKCKVLVLRWYIYQYKYINYIYALKYEVSNNSLHDKGKC